MPFGSSMTNDPANSSATNNTETILNTMDFPLAIPMGKDSPNSNPKSILLRRSWWLALACIGFSLGLFAWNSWTRGPMIVVRFRDGHGIKAESRLMHRGIEVGNVEQVQLSPKLDFVDIEIRLMKSAASLMREGSVFWIERPSLSMQGARGLETIVSGRYVAVEPGPIDAPPRRSFQGVEAPQISKPTVTPLEILLEGNELHGLQVHAPIVYRGLVVGRVQSVGLSADSRWIQVRAAIEADYTNLVRANSRFWNRSGFRVDVGLGGVDFDAESLAGIAAGGIEFATPDSPGEPARSGQRFELYGKADDDWKAWRPQLLHGNHTLGQWGTLPVQERLTLKWQESILGFRRNMSKSGWVLVLDDGKILGPSDLFRKPPSASDSSIRWEMVGQEWNDTQMTEIKTDAMRKANQSKGDNQLVMRYPMPKLDEKIARWPASRLDSWKPNPKRSTLESTNHFPLWIVGDIPSRWLPIEWHQIVLSDEGPWKLEASLGLSEDRHGAAVLDAETGKIIGLIEMRATMAQIVPIGMK
jgi:paraquat-inducible protein B